jgi:hypothetical protein
VIHTALIGWEGQHAFASFRNPAAPAHRSSRVMWELCRPQVLARVGLFLVSTSAALLALADATHAAEWATLSFTLAAVSQTIERFLFFTAVEAPRMPGVG